jgi:inner membrane protein
MENSELPLNFIERANNWVRESIMIKLFSIGFLLLVLLLPASWVEELISERWSRADEAINEISEKWSGSQSVAGPILVIPYKKFEPSPVAGGLPVERIEKAFFLPDELAITGTVNPQILHRGIFDAAVYNSSLNIATKFVKPDFIKLGIRSEDVQWQNAFLVMGISDLQGISDNPLLTLGGESIIAEPTNDIGVATYVPKNGTATAATDTNTASVPTTTGILAKLDWANEASFVGDLTVKISLKGSNRIGFTPTGKTTTVKMSGPWNNPSFEGKFLPIDRSITNKDFTATWKVLHFNRPFSQHWTQPMGQSNNHHLSGSDFGVKLLIPVDQYQKSMRTAKYAILMILLTFIALFLVEITQKIRIHPFQYILIGTALIIYYTLLLSLSEHFGYDLAYITASVSTVMLIGFYSASFLHQKLSILLSVVLVIFYTFIFVIILEQDYSLLIGSIGLFFIVALLMYFSRKVKWYDEKKARTA